ncbi:MAG: MerR family transcriptional regulator [Alphaproteobacteria bacterium]|nr:MerR family transcriptional regulator [Alphaproteobacteria bacterium]
MAPPRPPAETGFEAEEAELPDKLFFRIGEAATLVGVEPHALRYWESEFKMRPTRSPAGQRMYRRKDIARFLRIRRLLHEEGFTIAGARKALAEAAGGTVESSGVSMDPTRFGEAVERINEVRGRIGELRQRYAMVGVGAPDSNKDGSGRA